MTLLSFLALNACVSPETAASDVVLQYAATTATTFNADVAKKMVALACVDERDAGTELLTSLLLRSPSLSKIRKEPTVFTVQRVTLSDDKVSGEVAVTASFIKDDAVKEEVTDTFKVRKDSDGWCVVTGWAESKQLDDIVTEMQRLRDDSDAKLKVWDIEGARAALEEARGQLARLSEDQRKLYEGGQALFEEVLKLKSEGWVGGRWVVSSETDPMTDEKNVVARLESTTGLPNSLGREEPTHLIVRCNRTKLEVYIVTDTVLDSDWEYHSVRGQSRFGTDAPSQFSGSRSEDYKAVFLRNPRSWLETLQVHEADGWAVELPIYQRSPATTKFDLAATSKALAEIPDSCK